MAFPLLNISPSQLDYQFEADREIKATLSLRNTHDARVAFKIKTTASDRFVVCPPAGVCEPGTVRLVKIYLRPHRSYDDDLRYCKDRFLVQSIVVDQSIGEEDVVSSLFRSGQKQEAKLKVHIAAPLAHSSVLEAEIRNIAMRQGVEGHRTVVRKFSELLLAKGIISQAQVVLAFSTVGEIFQGMQSAYKASTADREEAFNRFLEGSSSVSPKSRIGPSPFAPAEPAEPALDSSLVDVHPQNGLQAAAASAQEREIPGNHTAAGSPTSPPSPPATPEGEAPQIKEGVDIESPNIPRRVAEPPVKTHPLTAEALAAIEEQERQKAKGVLPGPQWGGSLRPVAGANPAKRALLFDDDRAGQALFGERVEASQGGTHEEQDNRRIALLTEVQPDTPLKGKSEATPPKATAAESSKANAMWGMPAESSKTAAGPDERSWEEVGSPKAAEAADSAGLGRGEALAPAVSIAATNGSAPGSTPGSAAVTPRPPESGAPVWIDRLATPALPRTAPKSNEVPPGFKLSNGGRPADALPADQNKDNTTDEKAAVEPAQPTKVLGQRASKGTDAGGAKRGVLTQSNGHPIGETISPRPSQNGILRLDSGTSVQSGGSSASALGVPIPLGNTAKMAGIFGTRSSGGLEAQKA